MPNLSIQNFAYLYLADNKDFAEVLRNDQQIQAAAGAGTTIMTADEIAADDPFFNLDGIVLGSRNLVDEGYFDALSMVDWWRRKARQQGVEYIANEVVSMHRLGNRINNITLASGEIISAGIVVNAAGPRALLVSKMADLEVPIEPRRRYTYIFSAENPLDRDLPLTIDPSGVHFRTEGNNYLVGCPPKADDCAVDYDNFDYEDSIWEEKLWPIIASRILAFESIKVVNSWVGHYAFNTFDQNAVIGSHSEVENFVFVNGFSGHGSQQSPAMGRGVCELITYGEFRELDLSPFSIGRIERNEPLVERAVI